MSEREPTYLVLDEKEDFSMTMHIDADGYQRIAVVGYLVRRKADGVYHTPLTPKLFFGEDGQQLDTWRQYLHAGDNVVLSRDSGNPYVPDHELNWSKVSGTPTLPATPVAVIPAIKRTTSTVPVVVLPDSAVTQLAVPTAWVPLLVLIGAPIGFYLLYKLLGKAVRW